MCGKRQRGPMNNLQFLFLALHGRIPRRIFWLGIGAIFLFQLLVQIPAMSIGHVDTGQGLAPIWFRNLSLLLDVVCAWPLFAVLSKRQQDRNQSSGLSFVFLTLLLTFSILEAFDLTQAGPDFTTLGWLVGLPMLGVLAVVLVELGGRPGTDGPNDFGRDPSQ